MKVVILAGGKGTRISEESKMRPKPMVTIGEKPILWHIMNWYSKFGFYEFIVCCGYKGHMIKEYFINYSIYQANMSFNLAEEEVNCHKQIEPWKVTLVNTGLNTLTAGRILKVREYLGEEPFMLTYGDGVADVDLFKLIEFHKQHKKIVTLSMTRPEGRFGALKLDEKTFEIQGFKEKARMDQAWVNMGFMVMEPKVFDYLDDGTSMLETIPFENLVKDKELAAYPHDGFWSPMDNIHDRDYLEKLWNEGRAPWR